jgi:hypothetical protein
MTQLADEPDHAAQESTAAARLADALRQLYDRPQPPVPWRDGANLPWDDPAFSERMLAQHLDQGHGAASKIKATLGELLQDNFWRDEATGAWTVPTAPQREILRRRAKPQQLSLGLDVEGEPMELGLP